MLNVADAMKTCKNMKRMIEVLETLKRKCKRERLKKETTRFLYWFTQT